MGLGWIVPSAGRGEGCEVLDKEVKQFVHNQGQLVDVVL